MLISDQTWDQLFQALLWSEVCYDSDQYFDDEGYTRDDIANEEVLKEAFRQFVETNINDIYATFGQDHNWEDIAFDFILTSNHHGCGFWDGDYEDEVSKRLTNACKREFHLVLGDDGRLYVG